jgi:3'(2'), 5'-bisphosphate nucleotidase
MTDNRTSVLAEQLLKEGRGWMRDCAVIAMGHYGSFDKNSDVITKSDDSPLTRADLEIDHYLHEKLRTSFPDIPVVTEEQAKSHGLDVTSGYFFLVDPIDGTKEFINQRDEFTVNVALLKDGKPVAGIVCAPALAKCFYGSTAAGAVVADMAEGQEAPISVRTPDNNALLVVASRSHMTDETRDFLAANKVAETKNGGSSLKFCLLASGEADLYPRFGPTMEWDTAAGHAVLLAAGGFVDTLEGKPLDYAKPEFRNPWFIAGVRGVEFKMH